MDQRRIALICASNMNRSMEAHYQLMRKGFDVQSFGTGASVKLPGPSADKPNVYAFGTPYRTIYEDLKEQNFDLYTQNGLLPMLERNMKVKEAPQQWKEYCSSMHFDVIITYEERVFDACVEELQKVPTVDFEPVHVINITLRDNQEEALFGGSLTVLLAQQLNAYDSIEWEDHVDEIIERFELENSRKLNRFLHFY